MLNCTISHRGVPIGTVDLRTTVDLVTAEFTPFAAFDAWRDLAAAVGQALRDAGLFGRDAAPESALAPGRRSAALDEGASWGRDLELRNESGALVPTTFIEVAEVPGEVPTLYVAWIGFHTAGAAVPADREQPEHSAWDGAVRN